MLGEGLLEYLGAPALLLVTLAVFWKGDDGLSPEARLDLSKWVRRLDVPSEKSAVGVATNNVFCRIYGDRHFSRRCITYSILTSVVVFLVLYFLNRVVTEYRLAQLSPFAERNPGGEVILEAGDLVRSQIGVVVDTIFEPGYLVLILSVNLVADYVALLITRVGLKRLEEERIKAPTLVVADALLSALAFFLWGAIVLLIAFVGGNLWEGQDFREVLSLAFVYDYMSNMLAIPEMVWRETIWPDAGNWFLAETDLVRAMFLTTFVTSVWIWMAIIGTQLMRLLAGSERLLRFLQYVLPVEEKPVRAMGIVGVLAAFAFLSLAVLLSRALALV